MIKLGLLTIFLFAVRDVEAHGANGQNCQQLLNAVQNICGETEYRSARAQGPPGKKGIQGEKGAIGPVGPAGVVDHERMNEEIERSVTERVGAMDEQIRTINEKVEELYSIVKAGNCDVEYNGRCFHAITHEIQDVSFAQGKLLCERLGWKLANIYDQTHYQLIEKYLRVKIIPGNTAVRAWLGMTYVANKEVLLTTGRSIDLQGLKWYPSYPKADPTYTQMGIYFHIDAKHSHQGIYNYPANTNRQNALCEI